MLPWILCISGFFIGIYWVEETPGLWIGVLSGLIAYLLYQVQRAHAQIAKLKQFINEIYAVRQDKSPVPAPAPEQSPPPLAQAAFTPTPLTATYHNPTPSEIKAPWPKTQTGTTQTPREPEDNPVGETWLFDTLKTYYKRFIDSGNWLVKSGLIILFFGVSFLFRYSIEQDLIPIEWRVMAVVLLGLGLLTIGYRLKDQRRLYALLLQGGGIGLIYLVTFASLNYYQLIDPITAFILLFFIVLAAASIAVLQNAQSLAAMSVIGGFLAPVLISTGQGNYIILFSYYLILNLGICAVAFYRSWRLINLLGFFFTFIIGTIWAIDHYQERYFIIIQGFLLAHFLLFVLISILFTQKQSTRSQELIDTTLVFAVPLVGFSLQAALVQNYPYGLAISAFILGLFYLGLGYFIHKKMPKLKAMLQSFVALSISFATLAIPFAFDAQYTACAWALEGAALVWVGALQQRVFLRYLGVALNLLASLSFMQASGREIGDLPIMNTVALSLLLISLGGFISSYVFYAYKLTLKAFEQYVGIGLLLFASVWFIGLGQSEIDYFVALNYEMASFIGFIALSGFLFQWIKTHLNWSWLAYQVYSTLGLLTLLFLTYFLSGRAPFSYLGFFAWGVAVISLYRLLYYNENIKGFIPLTASSIVLSVLVFTLGMFRFLEYTEYDADSWLSALALLLIPIVWAVSQTRTMFPFKNHQRALLNYLNPIFFGYTFAWVVITAFTNNGDSIPFYLPIINPADLIFMVTLLTLVKLKKQKLIGFDLFNQSATLGVALMAILLFIWANAVIIRSFSQMFIIPYYSDTLFESNIIQTVLSVFWTLLAMAVMFYASNHALRKIWLMGAGLIGVVVLKLFLQDLNDSGTITRIISFISVGLLLLVIGYISPLPAEDKKPILSKE